MSLWDLFGFADRDDDEETRDLYDEDDDRDDDDYRDDDGDEGGVFDGCDDI